jgi:hypothetical protein
MTINNPLPGGVVIKVEDAQILAQLGENGERWIKGAWANGDSMCLHVAIRRSQIQPGDALIIERVAENQGWGVTWNEGSATTWSDIRKRLSCVAVTDMDLANTFGPQWVQVVELVRRAALLTPAEAVALDKAWEAAKIPSWESELDFVANDRWDAAGIAAGIAAGEVLENAAWDPAWHAAGALAVRNLVGEFNFTQARYNLVTGPWASVIGPVHPEDR